MFKDLANINLNLLMALDALLKERHVTNAGKRLHITQSAMSNVLKQLREIFDDELFIRGQAGRLLPTACAESLAPRVTEAIEKLSHVFQKPEVFNPQEAKHTFTIGLSDYTEYLFLPLLVQHITKSAPGINLVIKNINYIQNKNQFDNDELDIVIGKFHTIPESLIAHTLYQERLVCVGAKDNPLLQKPISKEVFAQSKHLVVIYTESRDVMITERIIRDMGCERKAIITVPNTMPAVFSLIGTDLIAVVLERLANQCILRAKLDYQVFDFELPTIPVSLVWHPKNKNNPAHRWLRELVVDMAKNIKCASPTL